MTRRVQRDQIQSKTSASFVTLFRYIISLVNKSSCLFYAEVSRILHVCVRKTLLGFRQFVLLKRNERHTQNISLWKPREIRIYEKQPALWPFFQPFLWEPLSALWKNEPFLWACQSVLCKTQVTLWIEFIPPFDLFLVVPYEFFFYKPYHPFIVNEKKKLWKLHSYWTSIANSLVIVGSLQGNR